MRFSSPAELGVDGEFAWLPWADTLVALTAVLAAYMLASSWNLPMFFLYRILLFPNQFDTCQNRNEKVQQWSYNKYKLISMQTNQWKSNHLY